MHCLKKSSRQQACIFSEIGRVMLAIWIIHWNCIKQLKVWSDQAALNIYPLAFLPISDPNPEPKGKRVCVG